MSETNINLALVTGASRGIGAAIADELAANGYYVVGTATSEAGAQAIGERLGAHGCGRVLDVADAAAIDATRERKATLSPLDGLDQSAIRAGRDRQRFDGDWDPRTSSLDLHHGDAAPRDATWTSSTFPF